MRLVWLYVVDSIFRTAQGNYSIISNSSKHSKNDKQTDGWTDGQIKAGLITRLVGCYWREHTYIIADTPRLANHFLTSSTECATIPHPPALSICSNRFFCSAVGFFPGCFTSIPNIIPCIKQTISGCPASVQVMGLRTYEAGMLLIYLMMAVCIFDSGFGIVPWPFLAYRDLILLRLGFARLLWFWLVPRRKDPPHWFWCSHDLILSFLVCIRLNHFGTNKSLCCFDAFLSRSCSLLWQLAQRHIPLLTSKRSDSSML